MISFKSNGQDSDVLVYRIIQKDGTTSDYHKYIIDSNANEIYHYNRPVSNHSTFTIKSFTTFDAEDSFWVQYTCDDHTFGTDYIITLRHFKGSKRAKIITKFLNLTPKECDVILY